MNLGILFLAAAIVVPPYDRITTGFIRGSAASHLSASELAAKSAKVDVLVKPNGRAVRCAFVKGSGDKSAGSAICRTYRSSLPPSVPTLNGQPSYALLRISARYLRDARVDSESQLEPDAILAVTYLPDGQKYVDLAVLLAVDAGGRVIACEPYSSKSNAAMAGAVCAAKERLDVKGTTDEKGRPVAYVTRRHVQLVVSPPD